MPVVFDEIQTEIAPERRGESETPTSPQPAAPNPDDLADRLHRELALIEARRKRLAAD